MGKTTITNPAIWADVPDVSVIRVGEAFYMVSTSMHSMPGCPIMKTHNLADWEIVTYVFDALERCDAHDLADGKGIYGKGSWAANLRHCDGTYYVCFSSNDMNRFYVYRTKDIENGPWERSTIEGRLHDPALLFDDGRVFVIYGNGEIRIAELTADAAERKPGGIDRLLFETDRDGIGLRCEGCHAYKIHGYYYLFFIEWPTTGNKRRRHPGRFRRTTLGGRYGQRRPRRGSHGRETKVRRRSDPSRDRMRVRGQQGSRSLLLFGGRGAMERNRYSAADEVYVGSFYGVSVWIV